MVKTIKTQKSAKKADKKVVAKTKTTNSVKQDATDSVKYTNMFAAYRAFWKRGFTDWRGTTSRSGYWWAALANAIIGLSLVGIYFWLGHALTFGNITGGIVFLFMISVAALILFALAMLVPSISLVVRRLHDAGFSAWWLLLFLAGGLLSHVPVVGALFLSWLIDIVFLVFMLMPTRVDGNPYHKFNKE